MRSKFHRLLYGLLRSQRRLWFRGADFVSSTKGCGAHGVMGSIVRRKEMEGAKKYSPPSIFTYPEK